MKELSVGLGSIRFLMFATLIVVAVWLTMWVGVIALSAWIVAQVVLGFRARRGALGEAGSREIAGNWVLSGAMIAVVVGLAVLLAGDRIEPWVPWLAAGAIGTALVGFFSGPSRTTATRSMSGLTVAVSGVALLISGPSVSEHGHDTITVTTVPEQGTAATIEDVWAEFGCRVGTSAIDPDLHGNFSFDDSKIVRTGTCVLDARYVEEPSYFFQASSPEVLSAWLASGDLGMDPTLSHWFDVYRDGAIAILNIDGHASYGVPSPYIPLPVAGDEYSQALFENARERLDEHGRIKVDSVPLVGSARTVEDVWDEWGGCRPGTEVLPADAANAFSFDESQIRRVGTCVMDDNTDYPSFFFEAASADAMTNWLTARDLRVVDATDVNAALHGFIYRDGAVAIVTGSGDAISSVPTEYDHIGRVP